MEIAVVQSIVEGKSDVYPGLVQAVRAESPE